MRKFDHDDRPSISADGEENVTVPRLSFRRGATDVDPADRVTKAEVRDIARRYLELFTPSEKSDAEPVPPEVVQYYQNLAAARKRK